MNKTLLAYKPYSAHPDDAHILVVLCRIDESEVYAASQYATWIRNDKTGGDAHGHYFEVSEYADALRDFDERGRNPR